MNSDLARLWSVSCGETYTYHSCLFNLYHTQSSVQYIIDFPTGQYHGKSDTYLIVYVPAIFDEPIGTIRVYNIAYLPPRGNSLGLPTPHLTLNHTFRLSHTRWQWRRTLRIHGVSPSALVIRVMSRISQKVSHKLPLSSLPLEGLRY